MYTRHSPFLLSCFVFRLNGSVLVLDLNGGVFTRTIIPFEPNVILTAFECFSEPDLCISWKEQNTVHSLVFSLRVHVLLFIRLVISSLVNVFPNLPVTVQKAANPFYFHNVA